MDSKYFSYSGFKALFGFVPTLKGTQATAIGSVQNHLTDIGTVMAEGKVIPELGSIAIAKLYEAQLAVNAAIVSGWNNGQGAQY